jgi:hypothetical protein
MKKTPRGAAASVVRGRAEGDLAIAAERRALVLFSVGQVSGTCLAWELARYEHAETVAFDYGQRHAIELDVRQGFLKRVPVVDPAWGVRLGEDHVLDLATLGEISETALMRDSVISADESGLPNTFVLGGAYRGDHRGYAHVLSWRARVAARVGIWLRHVPGV